MKKVEPSIEDKPKLVDQKRRTSQGEFKGTCFKFHQEGHKSYECPQKDGDRSIVVLNKAEDQEPKQGESFLPW